MDARRFDTLIRSLTASPSRRGIVGAIAGLATIGPLTAIQRPFDVEARKRHKHKHKPKQCKAPTKKCGAKCVAIQSDPRNCGSCGHACAAGESCRSGVCEAESCPSGQHDCGAQGCRQCCADSHCGSFQHCDLPSGACVCANDTHICDDPFVCWSCCGDEHCRAYGRAPEDGFTCTVQHACVCQSGSICTKSDQTGYFCADLQTDHDNCGECGFNCGSWNCIAGACTEP